MIYRWFSISQSNSSARACVCELGYQSIDVHIFYLSCEYQLLQSCEYQLIYILYWMIYWRLSISQSNSSAHACAWRFVCLFCLQPPEQFFSYPAAVRVKTYSFDQVDQLSVSISTYNINIKEIQWRAIKL
jgi:hypothetical protein